MRLVLTGSSINLEYEIQSGIRIDYMRNPIINYNVLGYIYFDRNGMCTGVYI